jgi:hypothetical protein
LCLTEAEQLTFVKIDFETLRLAQTHITIVSCCELCPDHGP